MKSAVQPFWTWPAAVLLAALAVGGLMAWGDHAHDAYMSRQLNVARLSSRADVVVLGSSKIRCAVLFDDAMGRALAERGQPARFVRITRPGALVSDFDPVFAALMRAPPRLVLIDADYLSLEPHPYRGAVEPTGPDWRQQLRSGLGSLVRGDRAFIDGGGQDYNSATEGARGCLTPLTIRSLPQYQKDMSGRRTATAGERKRILDRLHSLQQAGAEIALVQTPRSPAAGRVFPAPLARDMATMLDRTIAETGFSLLGSPPALPDEDFLDPGHVKAPGQMVYSDWLADEIARLLGSRPA